MKQDSPIVLAWTGASGMPYGLRLLERLLASGEEVHLLVSRAAQVVLRMETELEVPARPAEAEEMLRAHFGATSGRLRVFGREQWEAPAASGTAGIRRMVICPCTTGTLSAVATGASDNLMERAADVIIKEQGKLVMVVRETPLSAIHLENMLKLARLGVVILPANPGFYYGPRGVDDMVDFVVARILDQLGVAHELLPRWGDD